MASAMPTATAPAGAPTARPTGVTILAILDFIAAAFMLLFGVGAMFLGAMFGSMLGAFAGEAGVGAAAGGLIGAFLGVFFIILGALAGVAGYGLWTGKSWGWWLAAILAGLGVVMGLLQLLAMDFSAVIGIAIQGFIVWYLTAPGVQRFFRVSVKVPWHPAA